MASTSGSFSLFLAAEGETAEQGISLVVHGANQSGCFQGLDLTLWCPDGNRASGVFPLVVHGSDGARTAAVPLFLTGANRQTDGQLSLFLQNDQSGVEQGLSLFVRGNGITDGFSPLNESLPLFLRRDPSESLFLYLHGPGSVENAGVSLFVGGIHGAGSGIPMHTNGVGHQTGSVRLFTSGF